MWQIVVHDTRLLGSGSALNYSTVGQLRAWKGEVYTLSPRGRIMDQQNAPRNDRVPLRS